jgi:Protein of unknown function (DUF2730)
MLMEFNQIMPELALGFTILSFIYTWYNNAQSATKKEVEDHGRAIASIEATLKSMPNQEAFHKLQLDVVEMRGEQRVFAEQIKPIGKSIVRIEEFLLSEVQAAPAKRTRR